MQVYTVTEVSAYIKRMFETDILLNRIYVKGEVSNCKYHSSGHIYFTLKDNGAQISCVMFAGRRAGISFAMKDGDSVIVFGKASVYEKSGSYQIYADEIRLDGVGRLYEEFEFLKRKLSAEGLFDVSHKKKIPMFAKSVGIVTASTGAAIQDICQISKRRNPYVQLVLYPAKVQGEGAAQSVVKGIRELDGKVDVIIVGRGGGSIEDLWAFNEEITARAIYDCNTPIVSAVGHETDTTIADFVSDLRAPTPSAGAELCVYDVNQLFKNLAVMHDRLYDGMAQTIELYRGLLTRKELEIKNYSPENRLKLKREWLNGKKQVLDSLFKKTLDSRKAFIERTLAQMEALNPLKKLESGFSYVTDVNGNNITATGQLKAGDSIRIFVTDGEIKANVTGVKKV